MQTLILTLHIIVCVLLVILVLLQSGKEGMGVIFGGGNTSVFGSGGAGGILAKLTTLMAVIFMTVGIPVFVWARKQSAPDQKAFTVGEGALACLMVVIAVWAVYAFSRGIVNLN